MRPPLERDPRSRGRILAAAKRLFARRGYEGTSTAAIAQEAGTSESQLIRHFGSKMGLLETIFNETWSALNVRVREVTASGADTAVAIRELLATMIAAFREDPETAFLLLFEGRRLRGQANEIRLSAGFLEFVELLRGLIRRAQAEGRIAPDLDGLVVASGLLGAAEGMIRDRLLVDRPGQASRFTGPQIQRVFASILAGLSAAPQAPAPRPDATAAPPPAAPRARPAPGTRVRRS